jgi:hypothetical protein
MFFGSGVVAMLVVVGPRELPSDGHVTVWIDTGSGPGREITVPVNDLDLADVNRGDCAGTYVLGERECDG